MSMKKNYSSNQPAPSEIDALDNAVVLEFGTNWCGHCVAAQPHIAAVMESHPEVQHLKIEDGPGRALGRSFRVKLWPTLIFMKGGQEMDRVVRPTSPGPVRLAMEKIASEQSN